MSPHAVWLASEESQSIDLQNDVNGFSQNDFENSELSMVCDGEAASRSHLVRATNEDQYDLVCIGFGPANLALAIAIHDAVDSNHSLPGLRLSDNKRPKVLFLERQKEFGWHKGMLLPGSRMQITFIKDLATFRNPRSEFTFLNYLHKKNRLASFTNLGTFLPQRLEYEDYMKWCAASFNDVVEYGKEVLEVRPNFGSEKGTQNTVQQFSIHFRDLFSSSTSSISSKKVVLAVGGKPRIPESVPTNHPKILHSAQYATHIHDILPDQFAPHRVAVVGCGQSAAEVFRDLHTRFPNAITRLIIRGAALKPSDDSPFVNEIFDPDRVDKFYDMSPDQKEASIAEDRATNYSVVRPHLLEELYEDLYMRQHLPSTSGRRQHQILTHRNVWSAKEVNRSVRLYMMNSASSNSGVCNKETLDVDAVVFATGYNRNSHETLLKNIAPFRTQNLTNDQSWEVNRDYKVALDENRVNKDVGIWLSGCNESTHGLSDSLLSVLATRGGEMTNSIFSH